MILVNLLPHRELARQRRVRSFQVGLVVSALAGLALAGVAYAWLMAQLAAQQGRNAALKTEIAQFERQIKDVATLQSEIATLRARQQAVEDLQADRNLPVHVFNQLARQLPDGAYLSSLRQDQQTLLLQGSAQSNERVSEFLRRLGSASEWFARPELVEVVAGTLALSAREQRRVANFTIRVQLVRSAPAAILPAAATAGSLRP